MVHRPADSRLLSNLLQQEKEYLKQFNLLFNSAAASLDSFTAYAAASPPPASQVILTVAGLLANADNALKRYALGVEQWRDAMRILKDMEDDVANIMRDREILVTRLLKVSKSHKSNSGSGTFRELLGERMNSSSSLSLNHGSSSPSTSRPVSVSFPTSTKLAAAQSELQACETHLASKESELALRRCVLVREGLTTRAKAMLDCSWTWGQLGKEILRSLDDLGVVEYGNAPSMARDERIQASTSDSSSIGPSQSVSQIGHQLPPVPNTSQPTEDRGDPTMPRPLSVSSTAPSSLYYTPITPATYKTETVTYAPAISLIVPASVPSSPMGSDINTPLALGPSLDIGSLGRPNALALSPYAPDTEVHTKMHIPAAHAINEYDIPTAEIATGSGSGTWRHSRGESQEGLTRLGPHPQRITSASEPTPGPNASLSNLSSSSSTMNQRHILEHRITEEDLSGNNPPIVDLSHGDGRTAASTRVVGSALIEIFDNNPVNNEEEDEEEDDELPDEAEDQLIKQGKLAVVENPRFMSEDRRRELERQMKLAGQEHESEPEPEKKKFSFLHKRAGTQGQADAEHVTFAPTTSALPSTPKGSPLKRGGNLVNSSPPTKSPTKRFFGSLKGLFGARQPAPPPVPLQVRDSSPSRLRGRSPTRIHTDVGFGDDSDDDSPTKAGGGLQALLRGAGAKKKVPDGRWSTRTDNNIRKLARNGDDDDDYDAYLSENVGKGAAGDVVVKAGLAGSVITGARGVRKRSASDIETAPVVASGSTVTDGRKKLKKTLPPPSAAGPASVLHSSPFTQQKGTTSGAVVHEHPLTIRKDLKPTAPGKRSASVDDSARRTSMVQQGVGQTPVGGDNDVIVNLENRRRRTISDVGGPPAMNHPVGTSARGMPAAGTSTVSRGDTAAAPSGRTVLSKKKSVVRNAGPAAASIPTAVTSKVTPAAAKAATPSKPTLTRQPSVGKTQTPTTPNIPVDNVNIKAGGARQPQPHRQHSASSSGAIVLPAGGAHPSGTLISQPGWDAQALPTGGGLSRNNSILSGVSGSGGGAGAGGITKKQKQTALGHGMGSGTSVGRRSSLGSSSGHGGPIGTVAQPTQPAQSLMSIVEDVAKHNREWSQESSQLLKDRKKVVGGGALVKGPVGMVDVARAPPRVGRDKLSQLNPAMIKARVMETSTAPAPGAVSSVGGVGVGGGSGGGGRLVDIKAPGSVFDQRKVHEDLEPAVHQQISNSTTQSQQANVTQRSTGLVATSTPAARSKRPAKSPLRSALKNPSRTPSPLPGPFLVPHLQKQQEAVQQGSRLSNSGVIAPVPVPPAQFSTILGSQQPSQTQGRPTTMANGRPTSHDSVSQRRKGKRQIQGASDVGEAGDSTSTNDTGNEIFYTDDEGDEEHHGKAAVVSSTSMLNGHAVGSSDLSHSTTSTAVVHRPPATTTSSASQITTPSAPRRRKSVRVSLQPTFSPPPPAIDDDDEEEQKYREPRKWKQDHQGGGQQHPLDMHAPVPVAAGSSLLLNPVHKVEPDIWQNSSDEDAEYQNARRLLTRAARKEKDMKVFAAGSRRP